MGLDEFFKGLLDRGEKLAGQYIDYRLEDRALRNEFKLFERQQDYLARGYNTLGTQGGVYDQSQSWSDPRSGTLAGMSPVVVIGGAVAVAALVYFAVK